MTIYLFELLGMGIILFIVALLWEGFSARQSEPIDGRSYHVPLDERGRVDLPALFDELRSLTRSNPKSPLAESQAKITSR